MGKLMGRLTITAKKGQGTIDPPPEFSFEVSTEIGDRCKPLHKPIDTLGYYDPISLNGSLSLGNIVYSDAAKTIKKNSALQYADYSINGKGFITLDKESKVVNLTC